ncbi:hypothetical protein Krodi_0658 [Sporocytophaga myxococcoides]|uniref:Uncharacterized protein n=1 Tax=Sporocytophaga myxococcoides TaxID=153721 RepID=A0A098LDY3_9BACT|nr:hypothetical protein [Sporocytophaga myxococcoides]GAL84288.1 hypothetical protein Krodi_0658 [Sporocytophaga myxococcoides]
MNQLAKTGRIRTILISISILMVSLHTIYNYNSVFLYIEAKKAGQQIVRFVLTIGILIMVYKGKNWARIALLVLFSVADLLALISLFTIENDILLKTPIIVMIIVYSTAIYHLGFSKSFKAFALHQKTKF